MKKILNKLADLLADILLQSFNAKMDEIHEGMKSDIRSIKEDNEKIHSELLRNSLDTMKIAICSEEIPLKERVEIGHKYIEDGGNGSVKVFVHVLEEKYEEEIKNGGNL